MRDVLINTLCPFFGTLAFAVLYNVPRRYYLGCGFTGAAGWLVYLAVSSQRYISVSVASFFGTLVVVLIARILTVVMKCPITIFLATGIFPLVPGAGIYNTVYAIVTNRMGMASTRGIEAIKIAFAIVLGIVVIVSIPREVFSDSYWRKRFSGKVEAPK